MGEFDHQRLRVYALSIGFLKAIDRVTRSMPSKWAQIVDQLMRAGTSIALNIAEGAGESSRLEKARFYRIARRSAAESAAALEILAAVGALREEVAVQLIGTAREIAAMTTGWIRPNRQRDRRHQTGTAIASAESAETNPDPDQRSPRPAT